MELKPKKSVKESAEIAKLEAEKAELLNDLQRTRADFENFRKQVEVQKEQAKKLAAGFNRFETFATHRRHVTRNFCKPRNSRSGC